MSGHARARVLSATVTALRDAPFDSARWTDALNGAASLCGASSAQLLSFGQLQAPVVIAPGFTAADIALYVELDGPNPAINKGVAAILNGRFMQPIGVHEYMTEAERSRDPLYQEFFEPHDGAFPAFGVIAREGTSSTALNLLCHSTQGPLGAAGRRALRELLPHFRRAFQLQHKLEQQAASVGAGTLDAVRLAVVLCDMDGRVCGATSRAETVLRAGDVLHMRHGHLRASAPGAAAELMNAIRQAARAWPAPRGTTLVARSRGGAPVRIDVASLPSGRGAATLLPLAMVHIDEPSSGIPLDFTLVRKAFSLTRAEAEVAAELVSGLSSAEIARRRGLSLETINTQVKAILAKTECARRAELPLALRAFLAQ